MAVNGIVIHWIDSKATFGDELSYRQDVALISFTEHLNLQVIAFILLRSVCLSFMVCKATDKRSKKFFADCTIVPSNVPILGQDTWTDFSWLELTCHMLSPELMSAFS